MNRLSAFGTRDRVYPTIRMAVGSMAVVTIDDDPATLDVVASYLRECGYDVWPFGDARDALAALRGGIRPDLILLDLNMPGMTGFEFRRAQLDDPLLAPIPVIVLTGNEMVTRGEADLRAACILIKPAELRVLLALVKAHSLPERGPTTKGIC